MPTPGLGIMVRHWLPIGMLSLAGICPHALSAEDVILDDKVVPAEFRRTKPAETVNPAKAEVVDDPCAYQGLTIAQPGSSSSTLRKLATAEIPLGKFSPQSREKAEAILKNTSLYRRLPTISFEVDRDVYAYFLRWPDMAVASWRAMGISKLTLEQPQQNLYVADAKDGSRGAIEVIYSTPEDTLILCDGAFKSPLVAKPIVARSLMRLQAKFHTDADGKVTATHTGDVFVEFPSQTVETIAKVISPVSHSIADRNFKQLTFFAHLMTVAMERQPGWVEAVAQRMNGVSDEHREEFLRIAAASYVAARQRESARSGQPLSLDDVLKPLRISPTSDPRHPNEGR
jgi:hypothetical protein